jgi:hypothetical protein
MVWLWTVLAFIIIELPLRNWVESPSQGRWAGAIFGSGPRDHVDRNQDSSNQSEASGKQVLLD